VFDFELKPVQQLNTQQQQTVETMIDDRAAIVTKLLNDDIARRLYTWGGKQ
jgi:hypothetical protein